VVILSEGGVQRKVIYVASPATGGTSNLNSSVVATTMVRHVGPPPPAMADGISSAQPHR